MKTDIGYACAILEVESEVYKRKYDEIAKEKKEAIKVVQNTYIPDTPKYREELENVEKEFAQKIIQAQKVFAEAGSNAIEELRDLEMQRVQTVDETKLNKIKAIKDIPMSESELMALAQKFGVKGDYWSSRLIEIIGENNGATVNIESSFDTKMAVLDQLEQQMNEIVKYYPADNYPEKRAMVRFGYLTEPILENAKKIYGGKIRYESDETLADRAYLTILSKHGDIERGFTIQNTLKNAKGEMRNLLLCRLAKENLSQKVSDFAIELSGAKEEIDSFKNGKARQYLHAKEAVERALKTTKKEIVQQILEENSENEFMEQLVEAAKKKSEHFRELVSPMAEEDATQSDSIAE